jgi:hypothetical protein
MSICKNSPCVSYILLNISGVSVDLQQLASYEWYYFIGAITFDFHSYNIESFCQIVMALLIPRSLYRCTRAKKRDTILVLVQTSVDTLTVAERSREEGTHLQPLKTSTPTPPE